MATATATETKPATSTTTLNAKLKADGTFEYTVPKRKADELLRAYCSCRSYSQFPALKERAEAASKALAFLMLDLGINAD